MAAASRSPVCVHWRTRQRFPLRQRTQQNFYFVAFVRDVNLPILGSRKLRTFLPCLAAGSRFTKCPPAVDCSIAGGSSLFCQIQRLGQRIRKLLGAAHALHLCQEVLHRLQIRFCYGVIPAWIINPLILLRIGNSFSSSVMQLLPMMRHSGLRSQRFYPLRVSANRRNPLNGQGPCPADKKAPAGGYPQPGRKFSLLQNQEQEIFPSLSQVIFKVTGIVLPLQRSAILLHAISHSPVLLSPKPPARPLRRRHRL